jgi:YVTN family beta-propeller protein
MRFHFRRGLPVFVVALFPFSVHAQVSLSAFVNFESAQVNPIRLSADGTRLYALNTPDGRLSVFDISQPANPPSLIAEILVGIEPVSVNPRTNDEVWVVNQESNSVSVVSVSKGLVTDTINVKDEPADVVFAGTNQAFVSVARSNLINVYSTITHSLIQSIPVFGGRPRALAVSSNGAFVYAAFAISGNGTTIIPDYEAPAPPPPTNPQLPPAPQVGLIVSATDPLWSSLIKYTMPDNDVVAINTSSLTISGYYSNVGTINFGIAVNPVSGSIFVSNTDSRNVIQFETNLQGHWIDNRIASISPSGQVTEYDLNPTIDYTELPNPTALTTALSQPTSIVFDPGGKFMYVAAFGTDRVATVGVNGKIYTIIEIGPSTGSQVNPVTKRGPRGLALNASAQRLYVLNRISNTISVVNTSTYKVITEIPTGTFDPTPTVIKNGRGFLYDAKLSGNGTGACASCHVDAEMDMLAWNLGVPNGTMETVVQNGNTFLMHPMKGPMTTRTLRGIVNDTPYHWRGDNANFAAFNPAFSTLMGGNQLSTDQMSAYTAFINTVSYLPNPNQNLDRSLPTSLNGGNAVSGQNDFLNVSLHGPPGDSCNSCHASTPGPGSDLDIVLRPNLSQPMRVPVLRDVYQKLTFSNLPGSETIGGFGLGNDGQLATLIELIQQPILGIFSTDPQGQLDIAAYLLCFDTGVAPAVGYTQTMTSANVTSSSITSDWATLQSQAVAGNIDLIAKGTINGQLHGLLYQVATNNYETDTSGLGPFTQAQLISFISAGDTLSVMGVPVGSGARVGIDRNLDGILDGDR